MTTGTDALASPHHHHHANHPEAAAAAREKIAALSEAHPTTPGPHTPAAPTADLVTDRRTLVRRLERQPLIAHPNIPRWLQPILSAAGVFLLVLLLFKSPVIISQINYTLSPKPTPAVSTAPAAVIPAANTISIPKINVSAPVVYEPSVEEAKIQKALEGGVVHYGTTALPGHPGNVAIFGHSSNDWWEPGNYKFVFVLLDKLSPGDRVTLDYQSKRYTYEVTTSRVVEPTEVGVLAPTTEPTLTLITCSPPGTSLRRLIVTAKQIDPVPSQTAVSVQPTPNAELNLPSSAPSFMEKLKQVWEGISRGFSSLFGADQSDSGTESTGTTSAPGQLPAIK